MAGGLVFGCVAPHGFPLIPDLSDDASGHHRTRAALEELGRRCQAARPEVLVVATPHGMRVEGAVSISGAARTAGALRWQGRQVEMNVPLDGHLADAIVSEARAAGIPVALTSFGGNHRGQSVIPLDWGTLVPLWFLGHGRNLVGHGDVLASPPDNDLGPPVVIVAPSRALPRTAMLGFGWAAAMAAAGDGRRVAFVASSDWGHTHTEAGPYGYHPASAEMDALVVRALEENNPRSLLDLPETSVQAAAIDGLWQTLMLVGALEHTPMRGEVLSYEAPTYYGMLVAAYTPDDTDDTRRSTAGNVRSGSRPGTG